LGREGCFGRRVAAYRFKVKGHVTVFVRTHARPFVLPLGKLCSNAPQDIRLLQTWGR
jgi:hypothetical protein